MACNFGVKNIFHYKSVREVNESQFADAGDSLVTYRGPNKTHITVDVRPFRAEKEGEVSDYIFEQKVAYFKRVIRELRNFDQQNTYVRNDTYIMGKIGAETIGDLNDFTTQFGAPNVPAQTFEEFFDSVFIGLDGGCISSFEDAFNAALA